MSEYCFLSKDDIKALGINENSHETVREIPVQPRKEKSAMKERGFLDTLSVVISPSTQFNSPTVPISSLQETRLELKKMKDMDRELNEELEDYRTHCMEMTSQMEEYRNKYLQAQQLVEEQRQKIESLKQDNDQVNEHVAQELSRVKQFFENKLDELSPLPHVLKISQQKLQETMQEKLLLEKSVESITMDLAMSKENETTLKTEIVTQQGKIEDITGSIKKIEELQHRCQNIQGRNSAIDLDIKEIQNANQELEQTIIDNMHLLKKIDELREDCARQVTRGKERNDLQKRVLQDRLDVLERELAQSRATAKTTMSDKEEAQLRMEQQICNLTEQFNSAQHEIKKLRGHVTKLKAAYIDLVNGRQDMEDIRLEDTSSVSSIASNDFIICKCNRHI